MNEQREILFRGFHKDPDGKDIVIINGKPERGEWVEGESIIHRTQFCGWADNKYFILETGEFDCDHYDAVEVIPETVGQYTGLKDKNGRKIFEEDIVKTQPFSDRPYSSKAKYKQHIGVVKYRIRHFKNSKYEQDYEALWDVDIKDYGKYGCCNWSSFFQCEVVGNVHENPELLKKVGERVDDDKW